MHPSNRDFQMRHPQRVLAVLALAYLVCGWCLYANWATSSHPDCQRALTLECYDRVTTSSHR